MLSFYDQIGWDMKGRGGEYRVREPLQTEQIPFLRRLMLARVRWLYHKTCRRCVGRDAFKIPYTSARVGVPGYQSSQLYCLVFHKKKDANSKLDEDPFSVDP